jgi:hypothetical protein
LEILSVSLTGNCQTELLFILFMGRWTRSQKVKKKKKRGPTKFYVGIPEVFFFLFIVKIYSSSVSFDWNWLIEKRQRVMKESKDEGRL